MSLSHAEEDLFPRHLLDAGGRKNKISQAETREGEKEMLI